MFKKNNLRISMILSATLCCFAQVGTTFAGEEYLAPASCESHQLLFRDFFTSKKNTNWTFYNRNGEIKKGSLWMNGRYMSNSIARDGWILTHVGDITWTDYNYSFNFNNENIGGSPSEPNMVTAYFRVKAETGNSRKTMYRLDIWNPGNAQQGGTCPNWLQGAVGLSKYVNGIGYSLKDTCYSNITEGNNKLVVNIKGGDILITVNGKVVLQYTDSDPIPYGGVGVGQIWETNGWYDDIYVRAILP